MSSFLSNDLDFLFQFRIKVCSVGGWGVVLSYFCTDLRCWIIHIFTKCCHAIRFTQLHQLNHTVFVNHRIAAINPIKSMLSSLNPWQCCQVSALFKWASRKPYMSLPEVTTSHCPAPLNPKAHWRATLWLSSPGLLRVHKLALKRSDFYSVFLFIVCCM